MNVEDNDDDTVIVPQLPHLNSEQIMELETELSHSPDTSLGIEHYIIARAYISQTFTVDTEIMS